jgi:ABC-type arginine/histidine transport system permease subunit
MKLICGIALVFSLLMLRESIVLGVMIALLFAFAVWFALPVFDQLSEMVVERGTPAQW